MSKLVILIIKFYRYFISPILGNRCRYLQTCSEYFIEAVNIHGAVKGSYLGSKRILSCHPIKFLGGGSGIDFVPLKKKIKKGKI